MYVPQNPLWIFCGFANGSTFRTTFFIDESTMTLTPCGEFGIVVLQSVPLLFYSVINLFLVSAVFPRYDSCWLSRIFSSRILICLVTIFILISSIILSLLFSFPLKDVTLIEYAIISIIWAVFCILWILSKYWKSWTYSQGLTISLFFASKAFYLITVNRWILYGFYDPRTYMLFTVSVLHLINVIGNTIEWKLHRSIINRDILCDYINLNEHADEGAGWWSRVFFCWTNQLVKKGGRKQLNSLDDVFCLPPSLQVAAIEKKLVENSPTYFSDGQPYSIARSLLSTFGPSFFSLALLRIASDGFTFAGPVLLHLLVSTLENPSPQPEAFTYASIMILCSFLAAIFSTNFTYYVQKIGLRVRAATVTAIYDKLLRVPLSEMQSFSSGKILNLISTDVDRIVNFCNSFHAFWSLPVQLLIALYLLYREVGMAFISGLLAALFLIPINKYVTNCIGKMSEKLMHCKDQRIKVVRETMEAIRTVKASAWESFFETRIGELRDKELYYLKARKYLDAVCVYLWASAPLLITISILTTYTMVFHEKLTAAKVFTSLALVNILIMPLNAFPWVLNGLVEAVVSIRRLEWFFALNNIDLYDIYSLTDEKNTLLSVKEGHFFWKVQPTVKGVTFTGRKGTIVGITGDVGSGKSSLLLGLLGETASISECIGITQESVNKGIGYVGQERWLSRGSIRDNILCGKGFDTRLYDMVLRATCLQRDINLMPGGDQYEISDNGATLSGGQRTRVALARALYQDNSVYLLDEPFASLDRKVADTIWKEGIEHLKERGKLIIVATHDVRLLARADQLIVLGKDVMQTGIPSDFLNVTADELRTDDYGETGDLEEMEQIVRQDEEKQVGAVRISVCATYVRVTGIFLSVMIIGALLAMQSSKNLADWWLSRWTENQGNYSTAETWHEMLFAQRKTELLDSHEMDRSMFFLLIYASIAVLNTMFTLIRAFLFAYGGIQAARNLHSSLLTRLLQAPVSWWDRTPSGRVINRICADVYTCDDSLPFQLNIVLASLFNLIGALIITIIGLPLLAPVIALLFIIYFLIQKYYRLTTVELKRLTSLSLSPFYSHLSDTVNGLVTIRAQRFVERFTRELRLCLTVNLRAQFSSLAASQWLSVRLSLIAVSVVAAIAICSIVQHHITGVDSGLVGLAITYALSMTGLLNGLLGSFIETEKEMVSVERIDEYLNYVPKEENPGNGELPEVIKGYVEFKDVSLRYDSYLPLALDNVCLRVKAGQRVAVIGRTGSGKTSLFQAVLRTTPIETGQITIDDIDIATISLSSLRSTVGFISQQPLIFSGTLYENLTLNCSNVDRNQVSNVARVAHLDSLLSRIGGLDGRIEEGGKNLSFGERQVISICRILLAKSKLVLVDEATSHLDAEAHYRMMSLLSVHLPNSTVISSVHILSGLSEYDVVVEMERGRIVRYGPPSESFVE